MTTTKRARFEFSLKGNRYRVIDGDTLEVLLDRGWKDSKTTALRLLGCDAPEKTTRQNPLERKAGWLVKRVVEVCLENEVSRGEADFWASSDIKSKYEGRSIGRFWNEQSPDEDLSTFLLGRGFVLPYGGKRRRDWKDEELFPIIEACKGFLSDEDFEQAIADSV